MPHILFQSSEFSSLVIQHLLSCIARKEYAYIYIGNIFTLLFFIFGGYCVFHSPTAFWDHHPNILHLTVTRHLVTFPLVKQEYVIGFRKWPSFLMK